MNKTLYLPVIFVFAILFHHESFGQKNFKPGTVVLLSGDTLKGQIDYQNWKNNPDKITFRKEETDQPVIYGPTDISFFTVMNDIYLSAFTNVDKRSDQINELNENGKIKTHAAHIFLSLVVAGNKPLYYYNNGVEHFYILKDGKYELLLYKLYLKNDGSASIINANKAYISQLSRYLDSCSNFSGKLAKAEYTLRSLRQVFVDYYNCIQSNPEFVSERQRSRSEYGLLGGISTTRLKIVPAGAFYPRLPKLSSVDMTGGIFLDVVLPRNLSRISINTELIYSSYLFEGNAADRTPADVYATSTIKLGLGYIKMNNMARYKFPRKKGVLFVNAGLSNGVAISETNSLVTFTKNSFSEKTTREKAFTPARRYEQGYLLGVGGRIQRFSFEVRMEKGNGMSADPHLKTNVTKFFALFGFRLH